MKYSGTGAELRAAIAGSGIRITGVEEKDNLYIIRTESGGICTFVPSTGNVIVQGKAEGQAKLSAVLNNIVERRAKKDARRSIPSSNTTIKRKRKSKKIFIVHGHDVHARDQLTLVLHELGLDPFVLARSAGSGLTIIEALEREIKPGSGVSGFGIVLLTPDDMGHARSAGGTGTKPRARQNVILELGMLIGALGRPNVAVLKKAGELELPSDINGVLYAEFTSHVGQAVSKLGQRLREAGFDISADAILKASSF